MNSSVWLVTHAAAMQNMVKECIHVNAHFMAKSPINQAAIALVVDQIARIEQFAQSFDAVIDPVELLAANEDSLISMSDAGLEMWNNHNLANEFEWMTSPDLGLTPNQISVHDLDLITDIIQEAKSAITYLMGADCSAEQIQAFKDVFVPIVELRNAVIKVAVQNFGVEPADTFAGTIKKMYNHFGHQN